MADSPHDSTRFLTAYSGETPPPWDIGRPQPAFESLIRAGTLDGRIIDVGCGTGEHTLLLAERGNRAVGIDLSAAAIDQAREKAEARGLAATFEVHDALTAGDATARLGGPFDVALDSGVFHVFDDANRARYVANVHALLAPGGRYAVVVFSEREPSGWGPRRITETELRTAFDDGWTCERLERTRFEVNMPQGSVHAWLGLFRRDA